MHRLYQTVKEEKTAPTDGTVKGEIPGWLKGSLYRNGPGLYEIGEHKFNHLLDPMAMFQRFHFDDKKVTYQHRYLRGDTYKKNMEAKRIVVTGVGTLPVPDPDHNVFQRLKSRFHTDEMDDNNNINIFPMQDEIYACCETNFIHRLDPKTLESLERINLSDHMAVNTASAHPHRDPDGTLHNLGNSFDGAPKTCFIKMPPKQAQGDPFPKGETITSIKASGKMSMNYMHSFGMTENYYVIIEQPMVVNFLKILSANIRHVTRNSAIEWWPQAKARFRIFRKDTGEEINPKFRYEGEGFMIFHHINTYEDNGNVVVDVCAYKTRAPLDFVYIKDVSSEHCEEKWRELEDPEPRRYVLPLDISETTPMKENLVNLSNCTATAQRSSKHSVHCTWEILAKTGFELPQINYNKYNGRKYRYAYGVGWHGTGKHFQTIAKIDTETKTFTEWCEDQCYPSEPVFVAKPDGVDEDDGVLISAVNRSDYDETKHAFLLLLDAKSMTEVARAEFGIERFPRDTHGIFRPDCS